MMSDKLFVPKLYPLSYDLNSKKNLLFWLGFEKRLSVVSVLFWQAWSSEATAQETCLCSSELQTRTILIYQLGQALSVVIDKGY